VPAQQALDIAKSEYTLKKAMGKTTSLEDIQEEARQRQEEFNQRRSQNALLEDAIKKTAEARLKADREIEVNRAKGALFSFEEAEVQKKLVLGLELYAARQDEILKGKEDLAAYDKLGLNYDKLRTQYVQEQLDIINKTGDPELKLLQLAKLKTSEEKIQRDLLKQQHELRKRKIVESFGTGTTMATAGDAGGWSAVLSTEANERLKDFADNMRNVITGAFDALYAGMDSAIDSLTTKWMKKEKVSFKDIITDFGQAAAEEFRKMAADQMKSAARQGVSLLTKSIFGVEDKKEDIPAATLDITKGIYDVLVQIRDQKISMGGTQSALALPQDSPILTEEAQTRYDEMAKRDQARIKETGSTATTTFDKIFDGVKNKIDSIFGANGFLAAGFDILKGFLKDLFSSEGVGAKVGSAVKVGAKTILDWFFSANGNVMTQYGPMKLNTYASGGIASSPQISVFGEGRTPEAYVPLPDGRSIPVTMTAPATQGNGPISISITVNATTGKAETNVAGQGSKTDAMAEFGNLISMKVREEIVNQSRPNGLLNR